MKKFTVIASLICIATFVLSCAMKPSFINPAFVYLAMETGGLAILPVGGGQADRSLREEAGRSFEKKLVQKYPRVKIISQQNTGDKLVEADLIEKYIEVISAYQMTGTLKPDKLETIGKVFGFRYLVIPIIQSYEKEEVKDGYKYTIALEVQVWDVAEKHTVFQNVTFGEDKPSGWILGGANPKDAAVSAGEKAADFFPKPE